MLIQPFAKLGNNKNVFGLLIASKFLEHIQYTITEINHHTAEFFKRSEKRTLLLSIYCSRMISVINGSSFCHCSIISRISDKSYYKIELFVKSSSEIHPFRLK